MKYCGKCNRSYGGTQTSCPVDGERLTLKDLYGFVGQLIAGKYMVHELTNIGGMSAVYLAQQIGVDRRVAFKILLPNVAASNANLARLFEREAKTAGKLSHENIATIYDAGHTPEGVPYIVMEWLDGQTLEKEIEGGQALSFERVTYLLHQIAAALDAAHAKRVIHRDLKPGNIMLIKRPDGRSAGLDQVKVVDFGLAKVAGNQTGDLQVSEAVGTPNYASPEQFQTGADIDPRTDIYSLGIMLYQLLTGHLPFHANSIAEAVRAHLLETPRPITQFRPDLPPTIEMMINRMLAKTPYYRPATASEVAVLFEAVLAEMRHGTPSAAPAPDPAAYQPSALAALAPNPPSLGQSGAAAGAMPSYSLEELFRPLYGNQPTFSDSFTPRTCDSHEFVQPLNNASGAQPFPSGAGYANYSGQPRMTPSGQAQGLPSQPRNAPSGQMRRPEVSGGRTTTVQSLQTPVVNPAIGDSLSLPLLVRSLPGSRRQQIMAIVAIVLSAGLCLFLFWSREKAVAAATVSTQDTLLLAEFANRTGETVFDGALAPALAVQLSQTPFLSLFAAEKTQAGLRLMGRQPDDPLTREVARDLCRRYGLKALILGEIKAASGGYQIKLQALNSQSEAVIAVSSADAATPADILQALDKAARDLRTALGETLATIQKFNAPLEQATTKSLAAWQAFAQGRRLSTQLDKSTEALAQLEKAVTLDPDFALAHHALAVAYLNQGEAGRALNAANKAFQLSPRVSESERLSINGFYFLLNGDLEHAIETYQLMAQTYPRNPTPHLNLSVCYNRLGLHEAALAAAQSALRLDPNNATAYQNAADVLVRLDRYAEAERLIGQAFERKLDRLDLHFKLFELGFMRGDQALQQKQLAWLSGQPEAFSAPAWTAATAAFAGRYQQAESLSHEARAAAQAQGLSDVAASLTMFEALRASLMGETAHAQSILRDSLKESRSPYTQLSVNHVAPFGPLMLALAGASAEAQSCSEELTRQAPSNALAKALWLPLTRAALALQAKQPAQTLALLETLSGAEHSAFFYPAWLRGQAYQALGQPAEAVTAYEFIRQHRGYDPTSVIYPLAHLHLARAYAQQGKAAASRKFYQEFLTFWKNADADLPLWQAAKTELAQLNATLN